MTAAVQYIVPTAYSTDASRSAAHSWAEASRYDTWLQFMPFMGHNDPTEHGLLLLTKGAVQLLSSLAGRCRGSSSGFDLLLVNQAADEARSASELVRDLRIISGLTWEQIANLLGVSAKTVHNWMAGEMIAEKNLRRLGEIVAVLRYIDRGYGEANRETLLGVSFSGRTLFSLLADGEFETVKAKAGMGPSRPTPLPSLPREALRLTAPERFGQALSSYSVDDPEDALPLVAAGKRKAKARRKGV